MAHRTSSRKNRTGYTDLRSKLIRVGFSLRSFALANGYHPQTVYSAAKGRRAGVKSVKIMKHLQELTHGE